MHRYFLAVALALLASCATTPDATTATATSTACAEPRPLVCTMQFLPTCAVLGNGSQKEFASPCTACADTAVTGYVVGPCPE
jgi:hypothetical protein